jgi:RNA polymerase sigma-54 factor
MIIADDESDDLIITVNDNRIPQLRLNKMYEDLKKEARYRKYNKETREWLRKKYDDAKFLLQAIRQRKKTMLKVMTGIAGAQKDFFRYGESALKPLIYKDVADVTGMDVSTICRIVNGKYVQTSFGTFELRYFFSESLPSDDGEEISTRVIKQKIKELIDKEPNLKPHSDDKLTKELKKQGLNVARRTVAKYREQLRIPVARLRKEL